MAGRRRGDRGQRRADHADDRDHRHRLVRPRQLGLSRAAVPGHGARTGRPVRPPERLARASSTSSGRAPRRYGIRMSFAEPESVDIPAFAGTVTLRYSRAGVARAGRARRRREPGLLTMHVRRNQLTIAAVAFSSGCSSSSSSERRPAAPGSPQLSAQDLTVLVANLNDRNDQLRREVVHARTRAGDARGRTRRAATRRSTRSRADLRPVRAYAGLDRGRGPGRDDHGQRADRRGRCRGPLNELRNAGAEAIAVGGVAARRRASW